MGTILFGAILPGCGGGGDLEFQGANLVLISIDTLRADHLSAYGYNRKTSPNIDQLVVDSILFEKTLSQSPKTASSHMTLMTGLHPSTHAVTNWWEGKGRPLSQAIPTLATRLSDAGYACGAFTGGGNVNGALGFSRGFDVYEDSGRDELDDVLGWVDDSKDRPFFLFFHTFEVHDPYLPPTPYNQTFDPSYKGPIRYQRTPDQASLHGTKYVYHEAFWKNVDQQDPRERAHLVALYDAEILYTEFILSQILEHLRKNNLLENTLVVITADHGEELFDHGSILHNSLHREILHVPLIMHLPGGALGGTRIKEPTRLMDLFPTLLELLDLPKTPGSIEGRSLVPHLRGKNVDPAPITAVWKNPNRDLLSIESETWKMIWNRRDGKKALYHLKDDPRELVDRAQQEPEMVEELTRSLLELEAKRHELGRELKSRSQPEVSLGSLEADRLKKLGYLEAGKSKEEEKEED